jgi:hypothetical protein
MRALTGRVCDFFLCYHPGLGQVKYKGAKPRMLARKWQIKEALGTNEGSRKEVRLAKA